MGRGENTEGSPLQNGKLSPRSERGEASYTMGRGGNKCQGPGAGKSWTSSRKGKVRVGVVQDEVGKKSRGLQSFQDCFCLFVCVLLCLVSKDLLLGKSTMQSGCSSSRSD
jgi:hypothetical protein